jgi:hypothetical protein
VLEAALNFMDTPLMAAVGAALDRAETEGVTAVGSQLWSNLKYGASR